MPEAPQNWQLIAQGKHRCGPAVLTIRGGRIVTIGRSSRADITLGHRSLSRVHAELEVVGDRLRIRDLDSANGILLNGNKITEAAAEPGDSICFRPLVYTARPQTAAAVSALDDSASEVSDEITCLSTTLNPVQSAVQARSGGDATATTQLGASQQTRSVAQSATEQLAGPTQPTPHARSLLGEGKGDQPKEGSSQATQMIIALRGHLCGRSAPVVDKIFDLNRVVVSIGRDADNQIVLDHPSISAQHARLWSADGQWLLEDLGSTNGTFINGEKIASRRIKSRDDISFGQVEFTYLINRPDALKRARKTAGRGRPQWLQLLSLAVLVVILVVSAPPSWRQALDELRGSLTETAPDPPAPSKLDRISIEPLHPVIQLARNALLSSTLLADIDGDEVADIIAVSQQGLIQAFSGASAEAVGQRQLPLPVIAPVTSAAGRAATVLVVVHPQTTIRLVGAGLEDIATIEQATLQNMIFQSLLIDVNDDGIDDLLVTDQATGISALDGARLGWTLWRTSDYLEGGMTAPPLLARFDRAGGLHIFSGSDSGQVQAFTLQKGRLKLLWTQAADPIVFASPVAVGDEQTPLVAYLENQQTLLVLDAHSGILRWRYSLAAQSFTSPVSLHCNRDGARDVVVLSFDGQVVAIDGVSGSTLWQSELMGEIYAPPAIIDGNFDGIDDLVLLDDSGRLTIINGVDGSPLAGRDVVRGMKFQLPPLLGDIDNDGFVDIVVAAQNNAIHSYRTNIPVRAGALVWPVHGGRQERRLFPVDDD